eukprot:741678-Prorocentrum_minimum.AAC.1
MHGPRHVQRGARPMRLQARICRRGLLSGDHPNSRVRAITARVDVPCVTCMRRSRVEPKFVLGWNWSGP